RVVGASQAGLGTGQIVMGRGVRTPSSVDLGDLPPQIGLNLEAGIELDSRVEAVQGGFVLIDHLEGTPERSQNSGPLVAVFARVSKPAEGILVVMDGLAIEVQDACAI